MLVGHFLLTRMPSRTLIPTDPLNLVQLLSAAEQSPSACLPAGDLCISENERRVVSKEAWKKLKQYFPKAPEFPSNKECCSQCKVSE